VQILPIPAQAGLPHNLLMRFFQAAAIGAVSTLLISSSARADFFTIGIAGGVSAVSVSTANLAPGAPGTVVLANETLSGLSYAGSVSLCLLQNSIFGFELAEDYQNVNASNGSNSFQGGFAITNVSAHFTFPWIAHYHQFGVGYAFASLSNIATSPSAGVANVLNGFTINAKDYLIVDKKKGQFISARFFFFTPGGAYSPISALSLLLGFDI
jgi:hypothetical protein